MVLSLCVLFLQQFSYTITMHKRYIVIGYRLLLSFAIFTAVIVQFYTGAQKPDFNPVNFLSFFTILCNILAGSVLLAGSLGSIGKKTVPRWYDMARGAATVYMITVGLVFAVLLANYEVQLTLPWVNIILHYLIPVAMALDWLFNPSHSKISLRQTWPWLIFPIAYVVYSLIRGSITGWYPYPFLNPETAGGYVGIFAYSVGIALTVFAGCALVAWVGNRNIVKAQKRVKNKGKYGSTNASTTKSTKIK